MICVNDELSDPSLFAGIKEELNRCFARVLPDKSSYEKS